MHPPADQMSAIAAQVWAEKYRFVPAEGAAGGDATLDDTWWRVARAAAGAERGGRKVREAWAQRFHDIMEDLAFLPAGRIIAGAGTGRAVTLFNCFVMDRIGDDLGDIFRNVREAALTMQQGGGIGHDFSTLRPKGALVRSIGADASGPVSFMDVWDAMCRTIMSAGARRGAMMATLRCDHPDIEAFIDAKADPARLRNFNLSVLVTDAFMAAVAEDRAWDLVFAGKVYRTLPARVLWERIMRATYDYAEPGVVFIDRVNRASNLGYCEEIAATNPCGEQPLPPYGACLLGSINLARLVARPFEPGADIDIARLEARVAIAVRLLDNVIDVSGYPLGPQKAEARAKRRIGLGVTGLADALIMCGLGYGSAAGVQRAARWMAAIQHAAYLASAGIAAEKGAFPLYDAARFLERPGVTALAADVRAAIRRSGIRNGCLTSIAPTGTISLLAGNVSSGIEPVFDLLYRRRLRTPDGGTREETVEDYAHALFRRGFGAEALLHPAFVTAGALSPHQHLAMQAALQPHVDSAISKTINCPPDLSFAAFKDVYAEAYAQGLKGCTTFRPNAVTGSVLAPLAPAPAPTPATLATAVAARPVPPPAVAPAGPPPSPAEPPAGPPAAMAMRPPAPLAPIAAAGPVVYMARPLERDGVLAGYTYKLKWPPSDHAIYVTINDIERDGRRRPFEIFINTKNLEHYAWTVALTRMISAVFRRGGDVSFIVEELKAVFDPQGGQWTGGRYVPSLLAAIGEIIETHLIRTGFQVPEAVDAPPRPAAVASVASPPASAVTAAGTGAGHGTRASRIGGTASPGAATEWPASTSAVPAAGTGSVCPRCHAQAYVRQESCWVCRDCGFSRCG